MLISTTRLFLSKRTVTRSPTFKLLTTLLTLLIALTSEIFKLLSRNTCISDTSFGTVIVLVATAFADSAAGAAFTASVFVGAFSTGLAAVFAVSLLPV